MVIDLEGRQVTDFFAVNTAGTDEILSTTVIIDCNASFKLASSHILYINLYRKMFAVTADTAACSVSETGCNGGVCTRIKVVAEGPGE